MTNEEYTKKLIKDTNSIIDELKKGEKNLGAVNWGDLECVTVEISQGCDGRSGENGV